MSNRLKLNKSVLLSCSALIPVLLAGQAFGQAVNLGGAGNLIIPDGRTQTQVTNSGNTTDVHTNTVSGNVGFNSFSQFQVGNGNNVNLHLPQNTETLVNVVRDGPAVVEGTVNALKDGTIGGNVVFSDPYGFVLGSKGVINTGSLTVNTPTREFLDGTIAGNGAIDMDRAQRLISGNVPLSANGAVILNGTVNATSGINVHANTIDVGDETALERHRDMFEATVNTSGAPVTGAALVVKNGRIELVSASGTNIGAKATISANSSAPAANAPVVSVRSGGAVRVDQGARIDATASAGSALVQLSGAGELVVNGEILAGNAQLSGGAVSIGATGAVRVRGASVANGSGIAITSASDISLDGKLLALGAGVINQGAATGAEADTGVDLSSGGRVAVFAARDIRFSGLGVIDVSGTADGANGGDILVIAQRALRVDDGAKVTSRGAGTGNGGFAELSGHGSIALGKVDINLLSSGSGKGGHLLIDPADMVISDASTYVRGAAGSIIDNLGSVTIQADNTITVTGSGRINTYKAGAHALNVELKAKTITIDAGGVISANADAGFNRGNIALTAFDSQVGSKLTSTANAQISVNGTLLGKDVTLSATARAITSAIDDLTDSLGIGIASLSTDVLGGLLTGLQGGYVAANGTAKITLGASANVDASGVLKLDAQGTQTASNLGLNLSALHPLQLTTFFGKIDGETSSEILSGATVRANSLSVLAKNTLTLGVSAMSIATSETPAVGSIAVGVAKLSTNAIVHSGANITVSGKLTILADNTNSLSVTSTAMGMGSAVAGLGLAVHVSDLQANARLGANVGTDAAKVGDISVAAISDTLLNKNQASTSVGDNFIIGTIRGLIPDTKSVATYAEKIKGLSALASLTPAETMKGGFALMYAQTAQSAVASIGADTPPTTAAGWAPTIKSSGNISVASSVIDSQIRSDADASVESNEQGTSNSPTATDAAAVAIAVGTYEHTSHATIGSNVTINARNLAVTADSHVPLVFAYETAKTPTEILKVIIGSLNGNGGVVNNVVTSYAASTVVARDVGIASSLNFLGIGHDTLAWVGTGAKITTNGTTNSYDETYQENGVDKVRQKPGWLANYGSDAGFGTPQTRVFNSGVEVRASSSTSTVNIAGVPAWFVALGGNEIQGGEGSSGGGSLNINLFSSNTFAGVGAGVEITSASDVIVDAKTADSIVAVVPSSGKGAALGINGLVSYLGLTNSTQASVSHLAKISTGKLAVTANQDTLIVSIGGALSRSTGSSVGLAAAWSNMETTTKAIIGNNDDVVAGTALANRTGFAAGEIAANTVDVRANTGGANYTLSVAAAVSSPNDGKPGTKEKITGTINGAVTGLSNKLAPSIMNAAGGASKVKDFFATKALSGLNKISDKLTTPPAQGQTRDFSMAAAGSVSGVTTSFDTIAYIDGATIKRLSNTGAVAVSVNATNDILISTTSGSASVALVGQDSSNMSAAIAGAFAVAFTDNQTQASIRNTTIADAGATRVAAIASGQQVVLGLAIAANTNSNSAVSIAGSVSFGGSIDGVNAAIEGSTITGTASQDKDVDVLAYQNTDTGIGGLAISVSTKGGGFGLALTGTVLADPTGGHAASARILNSTLRSIRNVSVDATTVSRVMSGAGSVGVTPNGLGINGSIVFNDVSTSTIAEIKGSGTERIETAGNVSVKAGSERRADVDAELALVIRNKIINAGFDFSKNILDTASTGAVIFGVSGTVGVGQNNAGVAIQYGGIRHDHEAYLSGVTLVAMGDLTVSARDESKIFGTAAGVSVGTSGGGFAGAGSLSINVIKNSTLAKIYGVDTSVTARNVAVAAYNASTAGGGAGAVAISLDASGTGLGLSLINNTIANSTQAIVEAATLVANGSGAHGNIAVGAQSSGRLITFAVSVGAGGAVGVGGSVATSVALNDAKALVRGGKLTSINNVLVSASNDDRINAVAGGVGISLKAAGVGVSTVANIVRGETVAAVEDIGATHSVIKTSAEGADLSADSGIVKTPYAYNAADFAKSLATLLPDMSYTAAPINGLGIVATSRQAIGAFSLAVSAAINVDSAVSVAASVAPVINVLGGNTTARLSNALVNTGSDTNNKAADVSVIAASNTFAQNVVIGAAGGTGLAAAAGFVSNVMERTTTAEITGSTIGGSNNNIDEVLVRATGTMDSFNTVAGVAVGPVGAAGSMIVNVFDADTTARLAGGSVTARKATIEAKSNNTFVGVAGAGAGGGFAVAGAMNLSVNLGSTNALVGDAGYDSKLVLSEDLGIDATSTDTQSVFVVGAAISGGGGAGVAAMLNLSVIMSDTIASVNRLTQSSMRDVVVAASNTTKLLPVTGGLGFSADGAGIGAAANVMLTKGMISSEVINSAFTARGKLDVTATGKREINMITFTAGAGSAVGIGASIGIIVAGIDIASDANSELGNTLTAANTQSNQSTNNQFVQDGTPGAKVNETGTAGGEKAADQYTRKNLVTSSVNSTKRDSVIAKIAGSTITSGATRVIADSKIETINQAYGVGLGTAGVGAALAFSVINQDVAASVTGGNLTVSSLAVKALSNSIDSDPAVLVRSYAGAGSLAGGLGAGVAVAHVESDVTAEVAGSVTGGSGKIEVLAEDRLSIKTDAIGASASGGVALGVSLALSSKNADVQARIGANSILSAARGVSVAAKAFGAVTSDSKAGAGGLLGAGVGASGTALDTTNVTAEVRDNAQLTNIGTDGVAVTAEATPELKSRSIGVAVGQYAAVGASISVAKADLTVKALMGNAVTVGSTGSLAVLADLKTGSNASVDSQAIAGTGSLFLAASATVSEAMLEGETTAKLGNNVTLALGTANASVKATSRTKLRTDVAGVNLGSLALGANVAEVKADTLTSAVIGDNAKITANNLSVEADGQDDNRGTALAGGGGIVSGSAAVVTNKALSQTYATLGGNSALDGLVLSGKLTLKAAHENVLGGTVDSINAGIVGASGALIKTEVTSTVEAKLAENANASAGDFELTASNITRKPWEGTSGDAAAWNLNSGSGGIMNLPAGRSQASINHSTLAAFGKNASVTLNGKTGASTADIEAKNRIDFFDKVKLDSGGAIALADTRTYLDVTKNDATVSFGEGATIVASNGTIRIAAHDDADIDLRAASTTYGLAGAPTGMADINYRRANLVTLAKDVKIEAHSVNDLTTGMITIAAGASLTGTLSQINARTTLDLYNNTVIPISISPDPVTRVSGNSSLVIDGGSTRTNAGLRAAADIRIIASRGTVTASAVGTGKDIYREAAAAIASGVSELFGGDAISFDHKGGNTTVSGLGSAAINGTVLTGIDRNKSVTINYATADVNGCVVSATICLALPVAGEIGYTVEDNIAIGTAILDRLKELRSLLADYGSDPVAKGAYQSEIKFLEDKLIALGLSKDGSGNSFTAPSQLQQAQTQLGYSKEALYWLGVQLDTNAATVASSANNVSGASGSLVTSAQQSATASTNAGSAWTTIRTELTQLSGYNGSNKTSNEANVASINALVTETQTLGGDIATLHGQVTTAKNNIDSARGDIATQQGIITAKLAELRAKPAGTSASILTALQAEIDTARGIIADRTATIASNQSIVSTNSASIATKSSTVSSNIAEIDRLRLVVLGNSNGGTAGDNTRIANMAGAVTTLTGAKSSAATATGAIGTSGGTTGYIGTIKSNLATASSPITSVGNYKPSFNALTTSISTIETKIATNQYSSASSLPTTSALTIEDTIARLGDILVTAEQLTGNGNLYSPGDATISIINNTGHSLKLGNLTINSESGGRIRFNGVQVQSNADINAINRGGTANFGAITTATTQGSPQPTISVSSNYTVDSATFYNPNATSMAVKIPRPAPDISLLAGKTLSNAKGALNINSQSGNIYMQGQTSAGSVSIVAKNGDFVQGFVYGFNHIGGDPSGSQPIGTGILSNGAVNISARYLNINSIIQSGIANWSLVVPTNPWLTASAGSLGLSSAIQTQVSTYRNSYANNPGTVNPILDLGGGLRYIVTADNNAGRYEFTTDYADTNLTSGSYLVTGATGNIGLSYDRANKRFVVDGTNVRGGSIQIYGQILNTSPTGSTQTGQLNVLDGFGQINITNNDSRQIVIGKLDAGEDPTGTGRGIAGRIEITDVYGINASTLTTRPVEARHTVYTRLGNSLQRVQDIGYINPQGEFVADSTSTATNLGRNWTYDPQTNIRYNYTTGTDYSEKVVSQYEGTQFLGNTDWRVWEGKTAEWSTRTLLNEEILKDGFYVTVNTSLGQKSATYKDDANKEVTLLDEWSDCNWWTLCIAQDYTVIIQIVTPSKTITTNTLKADYPIAVNFIGQDTGSISVTSSSSVLLNGAINNRTGSTSITASTGNIEQMNASALIDTNALSLTATAGSVGAIGADKAVKVALGSATLSATAGNGNVVIDAASGINVGTIQASGDATALKGRVVLTAAGSITGTSASLIQAPRVELTSINGAIGSTTDLLKVNTGFSSNAADRPFGGANPQPYYGLKATAARDIGITASTWTGNANGTILVDHVVSTGGNVKLSTAGAILDNNPIQSIDTRTYADLLAYWNGLGLMAGTENTAKVEKVIDAFETQVASERQIYLQIRARQSDGGAVYDPSFAYKMTANEKLAFAESLRLSDGSLSQAAIDLRVADFEAEQTARYHRIDAQLKTLGGSFDQATGLYTASAAERAARSTGAVWTEKQLAFSLSAGALKTITGTNPVIKAANVSGRMVTLDAGLGLGEVAGSVNIPTNILPGQLTDAQKIALATAERNDFSYSNGMLSIRSIRPLNFDAVDSLSASVSAATGNAYLASMGDARLGTISVPAELRLKVRGSIVNANSAAPAVSAGSFILEAANGGIGLSRDLNGNLIAGTLRIAAVNTSGTPGAYKGSLIARSSLGLDVAVNARTGEANSGDANIDTLYSRGAIKIVADKSIRNANTDQLINVLGSDVSLEAKAGSVGSSAYRLNVGNALGSAVDIAATGDIYTNAPAGYALTLRTLTAGGVVDASAFGALTLSGVVTAPTAARFDAGGLLAMTTGKINAGLGGMSIEAGSLRMLTAAGIASAGAVSIKTTLGDAQVTNVVTAATGSNAISIDAKGRILAGTEASRIDLDAATAGAGINLVAGLGIGDRTVANTTLTDTTTTATINPLRIRTSRVGANSTNGNVALRLLANVDASTIQATNGAIDLTADGNLKSAALLAGNGAISAKVAGDLLVDTVVAGRAVTASAGGKLVLKTANSGGSQSFSSNGDLVFDYLRTLGIAGDPGDIRLVSANGSILGGEANANGSLIVRAKDRLTFTTLRSGNDMDLAAGGSVKGNDLEVGGELRFDFGGSDPLHLKKVAGIKLNLQSGGPVVIDQVDVSNSATFQTPETVVGKLNYTGSGVLGLSVTGYRNGIASNANFDINALSGVNIDKLYLVDGRFTSNGANYDIADGNVQGSLQWQTPWRLVWMNNRRQTPVNGNDVQLYVPNYQFAMTQTGNRTITNSYIVQYGSGSEVGLVWDGETYLGSSFVRDFERALQAPLSQPGTASVAGTAPKSASGRSAMMNWMRTFVNSPVTSINNKPAVNLSDEKDTGVAAL